MEINYGEEFIKLYNKELSSFKKEIVKRIIEDYGSPLLNDNLYNNYTRFLNDLIKEIEKTISNNGLYYVVLEQCYDFMDNDFKFERTKNIININFKNYFDTHKENFGNKEFIYFLKQFTKYYVIKQYLKFLRDNKKAFFEHIDNKSINEFFITKYVKNDLNELKDYSFEIEKKLINKENTKENFKEEKGGFNNPFSNDEKFIILHYLFEHERYHKPKLSSYEITLLLKITTDCFKGFNPKTKRDTSYDKFHKGYKHYEVSNRIKSDKLATLISKLKKINNGKFVMFLENKLLDYEFYNSKTQG